MDKTKKILLIFVFILITVALWFLISQKGKPRQTEPEPTPPSPHIEVKTLGANALKLKKQLTQTEKASGDLVLVKNSGFEIRYLISNDQFIVLVNNAPFETSKQKAQNWFSDRGFAAVDLCLLKISFAAPKEIKPDFSTEDALPAGCNPPVTSQ